MSYILDALRRAEAQRSRGAVPTLHAPVLGPAPAGHAPTAPRRWLIIALAGLVLASALVLWLVWRPDVRDATPPTAVVAFPTAPPPLPAPASAPLPAPPAVPERRAAVPAPVLPSPPAAESAPRGAAPRAPSVPAARAPQPVPAPPQVQAQEPARAAVPSRPPVVERAVPAEPPRPASAPAARTPVVPPPVARRDLPPDLQRELPALALNGTVYSPDPAQRMALVNGEVWREGDRLGPELFVDEIRRQDAVLRYKGQRFILGP